MQGTAIRYRDNGTIGDVSSSDDPDRWGTVSISTTGVSTTSNGDIVMVALDYDNGKIWYGKNGTFYNSGNPATGTNQQVSWDGTQIKDGTHPVYPLIEGYATGNNLTANFGQDSSFAGRKSTGSAAAADGNGFGDFIFAVPSNYLSLCSANLPINSNIDPSETDDDIPTKQFNVVTWTGNRSSNSTINNITGVGFQPDLVWLKILNNTYDHRLVDSSRGVTEAIRSNKTTVEQTEANGLYHSI